MISKERDDLSTNVGISRPTRRFSRDDYTIGWITALATELAAAQAMLDERHDESVAPLHLSNDPNTYTYGMIGGHNIVMTCLPVGQYGTTSATQVATHLVRSFPNIKFSLLVGIGGAAPSDTNDIRLGDVVVSTPGPSHGGVIQYDHGRAVQDHEFQPTGHLNAPPPELLKALSALRAKHKRRGHHLLENIETMIEQNNFMKEEYSLPSSPDILYEATYSHQQQEQQLQGCDCNSNQQARSPHIVKRKKRNSKEPEIHYGLIASGNTLMKNAIIRDKFSKEQNVLAFEMEAAGIMNSFPCLTIRGMSDYSDSHKNTVWQGFAAASAAAYAKALLQVIPARNPVFQVAPPSQNFRNRLSASNISLKSYILLRLKPARTSSFKSLRPSVKHFGIGSTCISALAIHIGVQATRFVSLNLRIRGSKTSHSSKPLPSPKRPPDIIRPRSVVTGSVSGSPSARVGFAGQPAFRVFRNLWAASDPSGK